MNLYKKPKLYFTDANGEMKELKIGDLSGINLQGENDEEYYHEYLKTLKEPLEITFEMKYFDLNFKMLLLGKEYWVGKVPKKYKGGKNSG